jgi:hypothetical protein
MKTSIITRNGMMNYIGTTYSGYCIKIYTSPEPAHPEDSIGAATLLGTITNDAQPGVGLTWEPAAGGVLAKLTSEVWRGIYAAAGDKAWIRICPLSDTGEASTTIHRIQMSVSDTPGAADVFFQYIAAAIGAEQKITFCNLVLPESAVSLG